MSIFETENQRIEKGRFRAQDDLHLIATGELSNQTARERHEETWLSFKTGVVTKDGDYIKGWSNVLNEAGRKDAENGVHFISHVQQHSYEFAWQSTYDRLYEAGWRNKKLKPIRKLMRKYDYLLDEMPPEEFYAKFAEYEQDMDALKERFRRF